jgi:hypothetical protein
LKSALAKLLREAGRGVSRFDDDPGAEAHFVRTRVKRLQSLCRLVPHGRKWRESFLPPCRELKDLFAETRDAVIVRDLAERYAPGQAHHLRVASRPDLAKAAVLIAAGGAALAAYPLWQVITWEEVADRAVGTYRAARRAWREAARRNAPDAAFHEWRRRVKRLLYQCEYLGGRARLVRFTRRVDRLGEVLGGIQDVCLAEDWLGRHRGTKVPPDLGRSKRSLRGEALWRGDLLLGPKPREFRRMLG